MRALREGADGAAPVEEPPPPPPPMTRRERREAERREAERLDGGQAGQEQAGQEDSPQEAVPEDAVGPQDPPAPGDEARTGQVPRVRRPVVRPPSMAQRPGLSTTGSLPRVPPSPPARPAQADDDAAPPARARPSRQRPTSAVLPEEGGEPGRRRWLLWLAALVVVVLAAVAVWVLLGRDDGPAEDATGGAPRRTATTLVALEVEGRLTGASLLSSGEDETAALLVPSRLVVDVASGGRIPLRDAVAVSDAAPGNAVGDLLGVRVDGTWVLTGAGLGQLVDAVGGVVVDADTEVRAGDVVVPAGAGQRLTGAQALAFATSLGESEAEAVRLARQEQVTSSLLAALPTDAAQVGELLTGLADGSRTTLPDGELPQRLAAVAGHAAAGAYGASVLPVVDIATGGETLYGLDDAAAAEVLTSRFAGAQREGAQESTRVLVQNGAGLPGLADDARTRLVEAGFRFVGGGNAEQLGRETSVVLVPDDSAASRESGGAVAEALGLPPEVVAVGQEAPTTADVIVVLGADFAAAVGRTP